MPKLIISLGNSLLNELTLTKETTTVGRNSDNDIVLDNPASGHHARIVKNANQYTIEDLGSTNGTLINGHKITQLRVLTVGDVITIGKHELRFESDNAQSAVLEKTVFVRMANKSGNAPATNKPHSETPPPAVENKKIPIIPIVLAVIVILALLLGWKMSH